jgi:glycosyltransferase involved in cell wall biosynthesis
MKPVDTQSVLFLAYFFPPIRNAGTRRSEKFVRYLPDFGYQPVVLTSGMRGTLPDDAARRIVRSDGAVGALYRLLRALRRPEPAADLPETQANIRLIAAGNPLARLRERWFIPDTEAYWYGPALRRGLRICRQQPVRAIYSTSSPETSHLVALRLKQRTGLPWLADFRDGWMHEPLRAERRRPGLRRTIELRLERTVVDHADCIVTVNEAIAADFARRYPAARDRIAVITNGYDAADFAGIRAYQLDPQRFRIVHTGQLALSRREIQLGPLLQAMRDCADHVEGFAATSRLVLAGSLSPAEQAAIAAHGLENLVEISGTLPHREALQLQMQADLLLLIGLSGPNGILSSKLFEYLASRRPMLALTGPSPTSRIVAELGAGLVVAPDDPAQIARALHIFYQQWRAGLLPDRPGDAHIRFEHRRLTAQLAGLFDKLIAA